MASIVYLKKALIKYLAGELAPSGFKHSQQSFYRPIPIGRQIFHLAFIYHYREGYEVVPMISLRHDQVERLHQQLLGQPVNTPTATLGLGFGDLGTGHILRWDLARPEDIPPVGQAILAAFWKIEKPFFGKFTSLEEIYAVLAKDDKEADNYHTGPDMRAERALVAAYLLGKQAELDSLIDAKLRYLTRIGNPYIKSFQKFVHNFRRYVKNARP